MTPPEYSTLDNHLPGKQVVGAVTLKIRYDYRNTALYIQGNAVHVLIVVSRLKKSVEYKVG